MANNQLDNGQEQRAVMLQRFRNSTRRGRGATTTELIILIVLISLVSVGIFKIFGGTIKSKLTGAQTDVAALGSEEELTAAEFDARTARSQAQNANAVKVNRGAGSSMQRSSASMGSGEASTTSSSAVVKAEAKPGSVGGINPWILVMFIGLAGLLVYVFFAKKSE